MYLADTRAAGTTKGKIGRRVSGNVLALGMVSLVTDISAEMVTAVLPLYLVVGLGLNPLQFGLLDGLYAGATALVRLVGGHAADRWRRLKAVAGIGYGLSAASKLGLLAAGSSVPAIGAVLAVDRAGKGIRTAPRDALISLSSEPESLGRSFGVHRAMDTIGAFLGPLVAMVVLWGSLGDYRSVFVTSFCIATIGLLVLVAFVRDRPPTDGPPKPVPVRSMLQLLRIPGFRRLCGWAAALALISVTDSFLYLALQRNFDVSTTMFPLLPLGTAGVYLLLAVPLGRLADRYGRWRVFVGGHLVMAAALGLVCGPFDGWWIAACVLVLHGVFYAATDGVLMAAAGPWLPEHLRASGMALIQTGQALARMVSAVLFGLAWTLWDLRPTMLVVAGGLLVVTVAAAVLKPWEKPA